MTDLAPRSEEQLYERIASILDEARSRVARSINTAMVHAYWLIGREIVEVEQHGVERAGYGEGLMKRVATRLSAQFGRGFSLASLKRMKQFYLAFPRGSALGGDRGEKGSTALSLFMEAEAGEKGAAALSLSPGGAAPVPSDAFLVALPGVDPDRAARGPFLLRDRGDARELVRARARASGCVLAL